MSSIESLNLADVSVVVHPPAFPDNPAPLIVLWHGFGTPNNEQILAQTLPLKEVQAWKAYLELPLFGHLMKTRRHDELMQRQLEDYVLQLLLPTIEPAMEKLPEVVQGLQAQLGIDEQAGIGLFGFSAGGLAALLALVESSLPITTAVLAGVTKDLPSAIETVERTTKQYYPMLKEQYNWVEERHKHYHWTEASQVAKQRLDFAARAAEIAQRQPLPAILLLHALQDEVYPLKNIETLYQALALHYDKAHQQERLSLKTFEHLLHHLDLGAAKNKPQMQQDLIELQQLVATWFSRFLT